MCISRGRRGLFVTFNRDLLWDYWFPNKILFPISRTQNCFLYFFMLEIRSIFISRLSVLFDISFSPLMDTIYTNI